MLNMTLIAVFLSGVTAQAQSVDLKAVPVAEDTTIEIRKRREEPPASALPKWEIADGGADVEGTPSATTADARAAWKNECDTWKKEFRADNKDNKILSINCGTVTCGGEAGQKICTSKATYKIKTRVD